MTASSAQHTSEAGAAVHTSQKVFILGKERGVTWETRMGDKVRVRELVKARMLSEVSGRFGRVKGVSLSRALALPESVKMEAVTALYSKTLPKSLPITSVA